MDKPSLLIVDDSKLMRAALKKMLKDDYEVIEAGDGEQGWSQLESNDEIQVVFTDLSMPVLDGFGLLARIRESDQTHINTLPVIVITGAEDDDSVREKAHASGATDFITKPFQSVQIKARAKAHVEQRQKLREAEAAVEEAEAVVQEVSPVNEVTGLASRSYLLKRGNEDFSLAVRHKSDVALISMAIDQFEKIVDEGGYLIEVLENIGKVFNRFVRKEDIAAYLGDGKFLLLLPQSNLVSAKHLIKRFLSSIHDQFGYSKDGDEKISFSTAIHAPMLRTGDTLEDQLDAVDALLQKAIAAGGNYYVEGDSEPELITNLVEPSGKSIDEQLHEAEAAKRQAEILAQQLEDEKRAKEAAEQLVEQERMVGEKRLAEQSDKLRADLERQYKELDEKRQREISSLKDQIGVLNGQLKEVGEVNTDWESEKNTLEGQLAGLQKQLAEAQAHVTEADSRIEQIREEARHQIEEERKRFQDAESIREKLDKAREEELALAEPITGFARVKLNWALGVLDKMNTQFHLHADDLIRHLKDRLRKS